ncbi:fatty acid desaturase [Desulfitispora alkaliphila]|uniref:DUF3796 domain-containing protein n=1 Tax=Desulfitispora alkaliphila TaxID=622674 RepID=UPI003D1AC628
MKKNKLRYLGLLGLLGLGGLFTGNYGMFGFFGFFAFFGPAWKQNDELLRFNTNRAALNAFVVSMVVAVAAIVTVSIYQSFEVAVMFLSLIFVVKILTFTFSLMYYERKGVVDDG